MKSIKRSLGLTLALSVAVITVLACAAHVFAAGYYIHDPMDNPKAAADIIVDPNAVYGYAPNPDSPRLGAFASYDWSDEQAVAQMRREREDYHASIQELYQIKADMEAQGKSVEEIARAVSVRRNEIRLEAYKDDPEGLAKLKESNLASFGNENGGTPDYFYEKYGSWETVIEKAFSTNAGADAVLGLYDKYFDTYIIDSEAQSPTEVQDPTDSASPTEESATVPATQTPTAASRSSAKSAGTASSAVSSAAAPETGAPEVTLILPILLTAAAAICVAVRKAD